MDPIRRVHHHFPDPRFRLSDPLTDNSSQLMQKISDKKTDTGTVSYLLTIILSKKDRTDTGTCLQFFLLSQKISCSGKAFRVAYIFL